MIDREKLEDEIRQLAYELYVKSGYVTGRDFENWFEAERIVIEKYKIMESEVEDKPQSERKPKKAATTKKASTTSKKQSGGRTKK